MRVLLTRPEPGASATASRLTALGHWVTVAPLLAFAACDWTLPEDRPDAVVMTSASAARFGGLGLAALADLPLFAVGAATAAAARAAGFTTVIAGAAGIADLAGVVAAHGATRLLHLAGEDRMAFDWPAGVSVETRTVYAAHLVDDLPAADLRDDAIDIVLLYSPRTAAHFADLYDRAAIDRANVAIAAISPAVLVAAGPGWRRAFAAAQPNEAALFAAAGLTSSADDVGKAHGSTD